MIRDMTRLKFNAAAPDLDALRQVIFARLRADPKWTNLGGDVTEGFKAFVELTPPRHDDRDVFEKTVLEVFWQLTVEEIIAPGISGNQGGFPWFRVTSHGHRVLADRDYVPHDRQGYLQLLNERVPKPDLTVLAYLDESLQTVHTPTPDTWDDNAITLAWLGHASVLINFDGVRILTDPVLFRASASTCGSRRWVCCVSPRARSRRLSCRRSISCSCRTHTSITWTRDRSVR